MTGVVEAFVPHSQSEALVVHAGWALPREVVAMQAKYICPGGWIATVGRKALIPLLLPFNDFFRKEGLDLTKYDWKREYIPIHTIILEARQLPKGMRDMLIEVVEVSSKEAHATFIEVAAANEWPLGDPRWINASTVAARAYVERPDIFDRVVAQVAVRKTHDWVDFFDAKYGDLEERLNDVSLARLVERLRAHWSERNRGKFAEVKTYEIDGALTFMVAHADLPRIQLSIADGDKQRDAVRLRPELNDLVQVFPAQGRLSIHTRWAPDVEAFRKIWGGAFWNDEDRYQVHEAYSAEPLFKLRSAALTPIPGSDMEVRVKEVTFASPKRKGYRMTVAYPRTGPELDDYIDIAVKRGLTTISNLALAFRFTGQRHQLSAVIKGNNRIGLLRNQPRSAAVFHFLLHATFALPPPKRGSR